MIILSILLPFATPSKAQSPDLIPRYESMSFGRGTVDTFAWRPDGSLIAVGGSAGIWLYAPNFDLLHHIDDVSQVTHLQWEPDGRLTSVSADGSVFLWTITPVSGAIQVNYQGGIAPAASPMIGAALENELVTASAQSDKLTALGTHHGSIAIIASGGSPIALLTGHSAPINDLAWSADGKQLASVSGFNFNGSELRLWDMETYQPISVLPGTAALTHVEWQPGTDNLTIAGEDNLVRTVDTATGNVLAVIQGHMDVIEALDWSPDGTEIASASDDGIIRVWSVATGEAVASFQGHTRGTNAVKWSPDGQMIASAGWDNTVRVWMRSSGKQRAVMLGHFDRVWSVAWSPDGQTLVSGSRDATVRAWNPYTGEQKRMYPTGNEEMNTVLWSPDGSRLAAGGDNGSVLIWDAATGDLLHDLEGHRRFVWSLAWYGSALVSGSWWDGTMFLWNADRGEYRQTMNSLDVLTMAWSPHGDYLITGHSGGVLRVWVIEDSRVEQVLQAHRGDIFAVAWRPDGSQVVSGGEDGMIKIWSP